MRFVSYQLDGRQGLGAEVGGGLRGTFLDKMTPALGLDGLLRANVDLREVGLGLEQAPEVDPREIRYLPPFCNAQKILCVGLNYRDHSSESGFQQPAYPTVFARFASSLIGHLEAIVRPRQSASLDYEGELAIVLGKGGKDIAEEDALAHVAGYSLFNDGSVREYQHMTPQWTVGKNFDATGAFGPAFVTADELPPGCAGLTLRTRLNGETVQEAGIDDMVFGVARLISILSQTMTLETGDIIVSGTPSGVGAAREPKLFMGPGDICEVEIEGLGLLRNSVVDQVQ